MTSRNIFKNKTIAFANQKGGCGKTTLCTLFADYLAELGIPVCVVDADLQRTISYIRKENLRKEQKVASEAPWTVQTFDIKRPKNSSLEDFTKTVDGLMEAAGTLKGCVLFDTPGNLTEEGLTPIYSKVDYIICPYLYDQATLSSTGVFITVVDVLRKNFPDMKAKLVFIPNAVQKGVGLQEEHEMWKQVDAIFAKKGIVTPKIDRKVCLQRYSTLEITKEQKDVVSTCFDFIIKKLYPSFTKDSE